MPYVVVSGWRNDKGEQIVYLALARPESPNVPPPSPFEWVPERKGAKVFEKLEEAEKHAVKYQGAVMTWMK